VAYGVHFKVWALLAKTVDVELVDTGLPKIPLLRDREYCHGMVVAAPGVRYWCWLDSTICFLESTRSHLELF